jgi:hypothetical protein
VGRFSHSQLSPQEPEKDDEYEEVAATEKNYFCGGEWEHAGKKRALKLITRSRPRIEITYRGRQSARCFHTVTMRRKMRL